MGPKDRGHVEREGRASDRPWESGEVLGRGEAGGAPFLRQPHPAGPCSGLHHGLRRGCRARPRRPPGPTACPVAVDTTVAPALQQPPVFLLCRAGNCGRAPLPRRTDLSQATKPAPQAGRLQSRAPGQTPDARAASPRTWSVRLSFQPLPVPRRSCSWGCALLSGCRWPGERRSDRWRRQEDAGQGDGSRGQARCKARCKARCVAAGWAPSCAVARRLL